MLKVRKKTIIDSASQRILRMSDAGIPLSWDRYEDQLPLCGFTQNGLNCSACLQGPCRISPFGDKPDHGICGADGRQIIMHNLLEKVRRGTLDHFNVWLDSIDEEKGPEQVLDSQFTSNLASRVPESVARRLEKKGVLPRNLLLDLVMAKDPFFVDPEMLDSTIKSILRMGLCSLFSSIALCMTLDKSARHREPSRLALPTTPVNVLVDGALSRRFVQSLEKAVAQQKDVRLMGTAGNGFLHTRSARLISPGSPELAVASEVVDLVLQSDLDGYPSLVGMCDKLGIPRLTISRDGAWPDAAEIITKAREHQKQRGEMPAHRDEELAVLTDTWPANTGEIVRKAVQGKHVRGVVMLIAGTNVRQTHLERTAKLMEGLLAKDVVILAAAEAAGALPLLKGWMDTAGSGIKRVMQGRPRPWFSLGSVYESARALDVLNPLAGQDGFSEAPVAVTFLEIPTFAYLASAFGWLAMGIPTQIGTPLPIWGNPDLTRWITEEAESRWGARLLATPKLTSPEEQVQQILEQLGAKG